MTVTRTQTEKETRGPNILVRRPPITRMPLIRQYDPRELLFRWRRDRKITMTPGFEHRILATAEIDTLEEELHYDISELADSADDQRFLKWLPRTRLALRVIDLTEVLKPLLHGEEEEFLAADTVLFPFGTLDMVSFKGHSSLLDAKAINRETWHAGTMIVSRIQAP
jgi:hypothetical protein